MISPLEVSRIVGFAGDCIPERYAKCNEFYGIVWRGGKTC
jgi:hypothetical protein